MACPYRQQSLEDTALQCNAAKDIPSWPMGELGMFLSSYTWIHL